MLCPPAAPARAFVGLHRRLFGIRRLRPPRQTSEGQPEAAWHARGRRFKPDRLHFSQTTPSPAVRDTRRWSAVRSETQNRCGVTPRNASRRHLDGQAQAADPLLSTAFRVRPGDRHAERLQDPLPQGLLARAVRLAREPGGSYRSLRSRPWSAAPCSPRSKSSSSWSSS